MISFGYVLMGPYPKGKPVPTHRVVARIVRGRLFPDQALRQFAASENLDLLLRFQLRHRKQVREQVEFMTPRQPGEACDRLRDKIDRILGATLVQRCLPPRATFPMSGRTLLLALRLA